MFFCFGSPRSGTTLISQSLSAHPNITIPSETDFIIPAAFIFDRVKDLQTRRLMLGTLITSSEYFPHSLGEYLQTSEVLEIVARNVGDFSALLDALYSAIAERSGAKIAGDKSPNDIHFVRILGKINAIGASTKIIHIVRDIRDVVAALVKRNMSPGIETQYARMWSAHNLYLHTWFSGAANYHLVRYEDFVADQEREIRRMLAFLSQPFDPATLDITKRHPRLAQSPIHDMLYQPTTSAKVGSFKDILTPDLIALCERQAHEGMATFGYR